MPSVSWTGEKHATLHSEAVEIFFGVINHTLLSDSLMAKSGFGGCQENITYWNA